MIENAGRESIVDASGCPASSLRDVSVVRAIVDRIVRDLDLHPVGEPLWHVFPGEAGVTGLVLLAESHVAVHTFPELGLATFNLYCCRPRAAWAWDVLLRELLGARAVTVRELARGTTP